MMRCDIVLNSDGTADLSCMENAPVRVRYLAKVKSIAKSRYNAETVFTTQSGLLPNISKAFLLPEGFFVL